MNRKRKPNTVDTSCWEYSLEDGVTVLKSYNYVGSLKRAYLDIVFPNNGNTVIADNFKFNITPTESTGKITLSIDINKVPLLGIMKITAKADTFIFIDHLYGFDDNQVLPEYFFFYLGRVISNIELPKNIKNLDRLFVNILVDKFPKIPESVESMEETFRGNVSVKNVLKIPENVGNVYRCFNSSSLKCAPMSMSSRITKMSYTYSECNALTDPGVLPPRLKILNYTYCKCSSLRSTPEFPDTIKVMEGAFEQCTRLEHVCKLPKGLLNLRNTFRYSALVYAPEIPPEVLDMFGTFTNCRNLKYASNIPNSVISIDCCYAGTSISKAPEIGNSVLTAVGAFSNCTNLKKPPKLPEGLERADYMFNNSGLEVPPKLNKSLVSIDCMFEGCRYLINAPIIPPNITCMKNTFCGCENIKGDLIILAPNIKFSKGERTEFEKFDRVYVVDGSVTQNSLSKVCLKNIIHDVKEHPEYNKIDKEYMR